MKYELIDRTLNPLRNIFWHLVPGITVSWALSDNLVYASLHYIDSSFEEKLGAWLTENVGKQGRHWDWRWKIIFNNVNYRPLYSYKISVKIIKSRQHISSMLLLRWA